MDAEVEDNDKEEISSNDDEEVSNPAGVSSEKEEEQNKRPRGRPRKIKKVTDILRALDDSFHEKPKRSKKASQLEEENESDAVSDVSEAEDRKTALPDGF